MENVHAGWRRKLMKYIADTVDFELTEPTVVTLGKFDGIGWSILAIVIVKRESRRLFCRLSGLISEKLGGQ